MNTYEIKLMEQKEGKEPARLGIVEVEAPSAEEALDLALDDFIYAYRTNPYINHSKPMPKLWTELA